MAARRPWLRVFPPEEMETNENNINPGVKNMPPEDSAPVVYFLLLFSVNLLREIVRQTNRYARKFIRETGQTRRRQSRVWKWQPVTITEMKRFMAIILNMGLIKKATISEYWNSKLSSQDTPWFRKVMSRNRFQLILKFFHVTDCDTIPPRNSLAYRPNMRFQSFLDHANMMFKRFYTPESNITVDETLVATRGRTALLQYIPSKAAKFGVKFWVLAESTSGYIMHMNCYLGKRFEPVSTGLLGTKIVLELLRQCRLLYKGYHVFVDSFFCSLDLSRQLLLKSTYITGTLRSNRIMPRMLKAASPQPGNAIYVRQGKLLGLAYRGQGRQKPVRLLSTGVNAREDGSIPAMVAQYNKYMGGVDEADMLLSFYNADRRSIKVWKKVVFNLIFRMVLNAYVLYRKHTNAPKPVTRLRFIQDVVVGLLDGHQAEPQNNQQNNRRRRMVKLQGRRQRDCCVCSSRRHGRKRTRLSCSKCGRGCHRACWQSHTCFKE